MASLFPRLPRVSMSGPISHLPPRPSLAQSSPMMKQIRALHCRPSVRPPFTSTRLTPQRPTLPQTSAIQHQVRTVIPTTPLRPPPTANKDALTAREKIDEIHGFVARFGESFKDMEAAKLDLELLKLDIATLNRKTSDLVTLGKESSQKHYVSDAKCGGNPKDMEAAKLDLKSIKLDIAALNQKTSDLIALEQESFHKRIFRESTRSRAFELTEKPEKFGFSPKTMATEAQVERGRTRLSFSLILIILATLFTFKIQREPVEEKEKKKDEPKPTQSEPESPLGKKIALPGFN
ncbi:hypothetical protein ACHAP7_001507 [Fusarium lateritium]